MSYPVVYDRVKETSTTTGTGTITVAGAVSGYRAFSAAFANGDRTFYCIENPTLGEWEVGLGTYSASTLTRDLVYASSGGAILVNFSAGTKYVFSTASAYPVQSAFLAPPRQPVINGGFPIWQRGTTITNADDSYGPDRFYALTQSASIQTSRQAGNVAQYACRLSQTQVSAQRMGLATIIEFADTYPFRSRMMRLQFSAKASTSTVLRYDIVAWTGTADAVTSDIVNSWTSTTYSAGNFYIANTVSGGPSFTTLTTSYQTITFNEIIPSNANNIIIFFWTDQTAAQNVTVDITDVMLIDGYGTAGALEKEFQPRPYGEEVALCQRYYQKTFPDGTAPAQGSATGGRVQFCTPVTGAATITFHWWQFHTPMRAAPTVTTYNPGAANAQVRNESIAADCSGTTVDSVNESSCRIFTTQTAGAFAGHTLTLHMTADAEL